MDFAVSKRLQKLPAYLFQEIDKAKRLARQEGRDIIDFGVGDPDQPTPKYIIEALYKAAQDPSNHRYALDQGMPALRQAIALWYKKRFHVLLDPETEILPLIGSKEGIAHFPAAFLNQGDYSLIPDPCYPPYKGGTILAGGKPYPLALTEENGFLLDPKDAPASVLKKAKLLYVNYPNNPTSATCEGGYFKHIVSFGRAHGTIVISDLAYSEIAFDGFKPCSILETEGAKECCIEFHSLSKTCNMTGWRIGWACGNKSLVAALAKVKSNIDSGIFSAVQFAGIVALENQKEHVEHMCQLYQIRRDILVDGLGALGLKVKKPKATFYVWAKIPPRTGSIEFAGRLLKDANIVVTPGVGFGAPGEGYIRFALTVNKERIKEAIRRLRSIW